ncbi:hypothetical protein FWF48_03365 [Candidatus Saccharibacteria bacterium]|nr:hypothetical protein [Candidatus Saccharibacteria bacterium]
MAKKKNKGLDKKTLGYLIAGFGVLLLGGIVWAATSGLLSISGSVSRGTSVDLDFTNVSCISPTTGYGTTGVTTTGSNGGDYGCGVTLGNRSGANGANDTLSFGMFLGEPGKTETVQFYIKNVGAVDADLSAVNVTNDAGFGDSASGGHDITLGGSYVDMTAQCIPTGTSIGPFTISATWPDGLTGASGDAQFAADLNYAAAASSC